jgi:hypothetical protein
MSKRGRRNGFVQTKLGGLEDTKQTMRYAQKSQSRKNSLCGLPPFTAWGQSDFLSSG